MTLGGNHHFWAQDPPALGGHSFQVQALQQGLCCRGGCGSPHLSDGVSHVLVDGVGDLSSLHSCLEPHAQHSGVVPQPPIVGLVPGQACAVDP